jgi:hypothetical protein
MAEVSVLARSVDVERQVTAEERICGYTPRTTTSKRTTERRTPEWGTNSNAKGAVRSGQDVAAASNAWAEERMSAAAAA